MKQFQNLKDFSTCQGEQIGVSDWVVIDQPTINRFAEATGDFQWIHMDENRTREALGHGTIAHGFLTLSLVPRLLQEIYSIQSVKQVVNYGCNKIRFLAPVPSSSDVRARVFLKRISMGDSQARVVLDVSVELKDHDKPAMIAEIITLMFEETQSL